MRSRGSLWLLLFLLVCPCPVQVFAVRIPPPTPAHATHVDVDAAAAVPAAANASDVDRGNQKVFSLNFPYHVTRSFPRSFSTSVAMYTSKVTNLKARTATGDKIGFLAEKEKYIDPSKGTRRRRRRFLSRARGLTNTPHPIPRSAQGPTSEGQTVQHPAAEGHVWRGGLLLQDDVHRWRAVQGQGWCDCRARASAQAWRERALPHRARLLDQGT